MGQISEPKPVKLFIGMLSNNPSLFRDVEGVLGGVYGNVDLHSPVWPWEHTRYYSKEMGSGLARKFIFFEELFDPGAIAGIKIKTNQLEKEFSHSDGRRKINLDPGYLDSSKLVLVSTKNFSHRIYLDQGIYGEVTLIYSGDNFHPLPYTFPDYRTDEYLEVFNKARILFKNKM